MTLLRPALWAANTFSLIPPTYQSKSTAKFNQIEAKLTSLNIQALGMWKEARFFAFLLSFSVLPKAFNVSVACQVLASLVASATGTSCNSKFDWFFYSVSGLCSSRERWPLTTYSCLWAIRKYRFSHQTYMLGGLDFKGLDVIGSPLLFSEHSPEVWVNMKLY